MLKAYRHASLERDSLTSVPGVGSDDDINHDFVSCIGSDDDNNHGLCS